MQKLADILRTCEVIGIGPKKRCAWLLLNFQGWLEWYFMESPGILELISSLPDDCLKGKPSILVETAGTLYAAA